MTRKDALQAIKAKMDYYESDKRLRRAIETLIPELAESEDERIRMELKEAFEAYDIESKWNGIPIRSIFAWLEKQKEPMPIPNKFSGLKSLMLQYFDSAVHRNDDAEIESDTDLWGRKILDYVWKHDEKQKEQKQEWSEEDKRKLNRIYMILGQAADEKPFGSSKRIIGDKEAVELQDFIKSLRPQYHGDVTMTEAYKMGLEAGKASSWKPSEEQMNKLKEGEDLTDLYYKEYVRNPQPIPSGWGCDGTHCTNPQMDCINCPRKTTGGSFSTSSASGTSAATLHGNTSVTDGKPHNPSFTD